MLVTIYSNNMLAYRIYRDTLMCYFILGLSLDMMLIVVLVTMTFLFVLDIDAVRLIDCNYMYIN